MCPESAELVTTPPERLADLLMLSNEPMFAWKLHGAIEFWNTGAERLYGFAPNEAVGHSSHRSFANQIPNRTCRIAFTASERALLGRRTTPYLQGRTRSHCRQPNAIAWR